MSPKKKIAVVIPAYNEELTIKEVILDFWKFPKKRKYDYQIFVIDNNSKDKTNKIAKQIFSDHKVKGEIISVNRQGKANAVKKAFRTITADVYIMVDADSTYWSEDIEKLIDPILNDDIDMVIGDRLSTGHYSKENKRPFHGFGNSLVKNIINFIFKSNLNDIMTGYRGFSRRLVKNYPILCEGFELETDMSIFCLEHKFNVVEVPIKYTDRPTGSFSKLNTYTDGIKVILIIFNMFRNYKPLQFFSTIGFVLMILGLIVGGFPIANYIETRYVTQVPMAILSVGLVITSVLAFSIGLILSSVRRYQNINFEVRMLDED
jgi:glycosyltransferase involved in cell wall biosynthesis